MVLSVGGRASVQNWGDALQETTCVESPRRSDFDWLYTMLYLWNDWCLWCFSPLKVLLDFSCLGCKTISAHSLPFPGRGTCLGSSIEQFFCCFFKFHCWVLACWVNRNWICIHTGCMAALGKSCPLWICLFLLKLMIWEQSWHSRN